MWPDPSYMFDGPETRLESASQRLAGDFEPERGTVLIPDSESALAYAKARQRDPKGAGFGPDLVLVSDPT